MTGKEAEKILDEVGVTVNKNAIPYDPASPFITSGIRIGTAALTTRGMKEADMEIVADIIAMVLNHPTDDAVKAKAVKLISELCKKHPLYA
jgi:glycine hydroxymethyltransferase